MTEISIKEINENVVKLIGDDWALITAGNQENGFNTMTASWAQIGTLWGKNNPTAVIYIRPQRYTKEFVDREDYFTLSFFDAKYKEELAYLGSHSGRNEDKLSKTSLTPLFVDGTTCFKEAKYVLICKKVYSAPLDKNRILDKKIIEQNYPLNDFHTVYYGHILKAYKQ